MKKSLEENNCTNEQKQRNGDWKNVESEKGELVIDTYTQDAVSEAPTQHRGESIQCIQVIKEIDLVPRDNQILCSTEKGKSNHNPTKDLKKRKNAGSINGQIETNTKSTLNKKLPIVEIFRTKEEKNTEKDFKDLSLNETINKRNSISEKFSNQLKSNSLNVLEPTKSLNDLEPTISLNELGSTKTVKSSAKLYSLNQLGQKSLNQLGSTNSLNDLGPTNSSLNYVNSPGKLHSLNHLGQKSLNQLGSTNSLNDLWPTNSSLNSVNQPGKLDSLNHLGQKSLNQLGSTISLNVLGTPNSLLNPVNVDSLNQLDKTSLNQLGPKNYLNDLGPTNSSIKSLNQLGTTNSLNDLGLPNSMEPSTKQIQGGKTHSKPQEQTNSLNHLGQTNYLNHLGQTSLNQLGQTSLNHLEQTNYLNELGSASSFNQEKTNSLNEITKNSESFSENETSNIDHSQESSIESEEQEEREDPFKYFSDEFYTVMYSNVDQSLTGKMNEMLGCIEKHKPSIIMLTEIEPKAKKDQTKQIKDSEISIQNYALFTNKERKRGVAVYIDKKLNPRECTQDINEKFEECVFL